MRDYTKGQIYMIEPKCEYEEGDVYYGSTIDLLSKRVAVHRHKSNSCLSKILIEKYGEVKIVLVKLFPCNSKQELQAEEGNYIRNNKCINKQIAGRTQKEWNEENKEQIKEYYDNYRETHKKEMKEYYKKNKETILKRLKEKTKCECGCIVIKNSLNRHKLTPKHLKLYK